VASASPFTAVARVGHSRDRLTTCITLLLSFLLLFAIEKQTSGRGLFRAFFWIMHANEKGVEKILGIGVIVFVVIFC